MTFVQPVAFALLVLGSVAEANPAAAPPAARAASQVTHIGPLKLAALPLNSGSTKLKPELVKVLNELMLTQVSADGRIGQLISGSDLTDLLNLEQQREALGCEATECMTQLAKAIDVPYLLVAQVGFIAEQVVFNAKILDVSQANVIVRSGGLVDTTDALPGLVTRTVKEVLKGFVGHTQPTVNSARDKTLESAQALAVLDLEAVHGVKASMAEVLSDILLSRLAESRRFSSIIAGEDLRDILSLEEQKAATGCADDSCMTALGGALGVPLMAVPSIGRIGDQFILNLKVIQVEEAKVVARKSATAQKETDLPKAVLQLSEDALEALFGADATMTAGQLERRLQRNLMRRSAMVLALGALGTMGWSVVDLGQAQAAHDDPATGLSTDTFDQLLAAQEVAVTARWASIGGAALAGALWTLAPAIDPP
jgi:hypothetical protein